MIHGIGIDMVEIQRFKHWHTYTEQQLKRIFTADEIAYCKKISALSAQRFAARFAAREAAYKACSSLFANHTISFLKFCRSAQVTSDGNGRPALDIDWSLLNISKPGYMFYLSLTHTHAIAGAVVILDAI
jgi:holo-[acyl-carrier protein] synthase